MMKISLDSNSQQQSPYFPDPANPAEQGMQSVGYDTIDTPHTGQNTPPPAVNDMFGTPFTGQGMPPAGNFVFGVKPAAQDTPPTVQGMPPAEDAPPAVNDMFAISSEQPAHQPIPVRICQHCGDALPKGVNFCGKCGNVYSPMPSLSAAAQKPPPLHGNTDWQQPPRMPAAVPGSNNSHSPMSSPSRDEGYSPMSQPPLHGNTDWQPPPRMPAATPGSNSGYSQMSPPSGYSQMSPPSRDGGYSPMTPPNRDDDSFGQPVSPYGQTPTYTDITETSDFKMIKIVVGVAIALFVFIGSIMAAGRPQEVTIHNNAAFAIYDITMQSKDKSETLRFDIRIPSGGKATIRVPKNPKQWLLEFEADGLDKRVDFKDTVFESAGHKTIRIKSGQTNLGYSMLYTVYVEFCS